MIGELCFAGAALTSLYLSKTKEIRLEKEFSKMIIEKWDNLMSGLSKESTTNKIDQTYEILKVIPKHYGFNAIVGFPYGKGMKELKLIIPHINAIYKGDSIIELSEDKNTAYLRVRFINRDIKDKDKVRFLWHKTFNSIHNEYFESYSINYIKDILNPNNNEIVGYELDINIPIGLSYDKLKDMEETLDTTLGKTFINYKSSERKTTCQIITKPLNNKEQFIPIKVNEYQLYIAMGYDYKPIIADNSLAGNIITGGINGSGKTTGQVTSLLNLIYWNDETKVNLFVGMVSEKQDLRIFKNTKHCKYYASDINDLRKMLKYLLNECDRRNRILNEYRGKYLVNIVEYNKLSKKEDKLPVIYFVCDEIADFMPSDSDGKNLKEIKAECSGLFWEIARKGRSACIFCNVATQRGDTQNLGANVKAQMNNRVCFYQPNLTSAQTIFGNGDKIANKVTKLDRLMRECLTETYDGLMLGKCLYNTTDNMSKLVEKCIDEDKKFMKLDNNGNEIIDIKAPETLEEVASEVEETVDIKDNKVTQLSRFEQFINKKKESKIEAKRLEEEKIEKLKAAKERMRNNGF